MEPDRPRSGASKDEAELALKQARTKSRQSRLEAECVVGALHHDPWKIVAGLRQGKATIPPRELADKTGDRNRKRVELCCGRWAVASSN